MTGRGSTGGAARRAARAGRRVASDLVPRRGMPLRRRISLAAAGAVAIAVAIAVVVCYLAVSYRLNNELDSSLKDQAAYDIAYVKSFQQLPATNGNMANLGYTANGGGAAPYETYVTSTGEVQATAGAQLSSSAPEVAIAAGRHSASLRHVSVDGTPICVYTFRVGETPSGVGVALELGRPLTENQSLLHELRLILLVLFLFAVPLAALFGRFAARRVLRPLSEVTATAEAIAETDDLSRRINVRDDDEVGQLASRFNAMLERLGASREQVDESIRSQRQLVADASHELRTPVTSLRTNIEVLLASPDLDEPDRQLLEDVLEQSEELTTLVSDLIEVARGELQPESMDDVRFDRLVDDALTRARRNAPGTDYHAELTPVVVQGNPERLMRAVNNLLDNAAKHAGSGRVDVTVDAHGLTVRDHGGGIDPSDLPYIFDRFYRGVNSRSTQGSGLGLAIVHQTAEQHGGSVGAANAPDGGAIFTFDLPTAPPEAGREGEGGSAPGEAGYGAGDLTTRA